MAGLPKKYAKMGFAKGWRAYKRSKNRGRARKTTRTPLKTRRRRTMARRKKRSYKRGGAKGLFKLMLAGAGYGVVREPLSQLTARIPYVGGMGDEVALLIGSSVIATKTSGIFRQIGKAGVVIEAHNLGRMLAGGTIGLFSAKPTSTTQSFR